MKKTNQKRTPQPALARRKFLIGGSAAAASVAMSGLLRAQQSLPGQRPAGGLQLIKPKHTMVYINLRGGADGLAFVAPVGDADYLLIRPNLAMTGGMRLPSSNLGNNYWHLSPALAPLRSAFFNRDLALSPATGQLEINKSHFVAQDHLELGTPPSSQGYTGTITTGFIARHLLNANFSMTSPLRGMVHQKLATAAFRGAPKSLAIADPPNFAFPGDVFMEGALGLMNANQQQVMKEANANSFAAIDHLNMVNFSTGTNGYPTDSMGAITTLGRRLRDAEDMILAGLAPEVIEIDLGGWDTHNMQGPNPGGGMYLLMDMLGKSLGNFYSRLAAGTIQGTTASGISRTTVVTISEFGRRIHENTTGGTDHGNGGLMMVMGGRVNGGVYDDDYFANWQAAPPGTSPLTASADSQGDVSALTDFRDIFAEAFRELMGLQNEADVFFPGYSLPNPRANFFR